jgi:2-haloacid dehalogenase
MVHSACFISSVSFLTFAFCFFFTIKHLFRLNSAYPDIIFRIASDHPSLVIMLPHPVLNDLTSPTPLPSPANLFINITMALPTPPRALLFDVFGTCVDWRTTVTHELNAQAHAALNAATRSIATRVRMQASEMTVEHWGVFAQQWRDGYKIFTRSLAEDPTLAWKTVDEHHLESLRELLKEWKLEGLWLDDEVHTLSLVWHKLEPWPDSSLGLQALNKLFCMSHASSLV